MSAFIFFSDGKMPLCPLYATAFNLECGTDATYRKETDVSLSCDLSGTMAVSTVCKAVAEGKCIFS